MKKIISLILVVLLLFTLTGCKIVMTEDEAEEYGGFMEWLGFEKCEDDEC